MAVNNFHFKLDIEREDHIPKFRLKQYDTAIFYASLYKNGLPYNFEDEKIKMFIKKADKTIVYQEDNITIQGDEVKINVKNQAFTATGLAYAELELKSASGQVTTATFLFEVREKVGSDQAIESITDICTLEKVDKFVEEAKKTLDRFKDELSSLSDLVANKDNLQIQNTEAKNNIKTLENVLSLASNIVSDKGKKVIGNNIITESINGYVQDIKIFGKTVIVDSKLQSVGENIDNIKIISRKENGNIFDGNFLNAFISKDKIILDNDAKSVICKVSKNTDYVFSTSKNFDRAIVIGNNSNLNINTSYKTLNARKVDNTILFNSGNYCYVCIYFNSSNSDFNDVVINEGTNPIPYEKSKYSVKNLLYYDETTKSWKKPVLRGINNNICDVIEQHENNKYYFHERCKQEPYTPGDENNDSYITDRVNTVKALSKENIYECLDISVRSFNDKTLVYIDSELIDSGLEYYIPISFVAADNSICLKMDGLDLLNFDINSIKLPNLNLKESLDGEYFNINRGQVTDFNTAIKEGKYKVNNDSGISHAPYSGSIYGILEVNFINNTDILQKFVKTDGKVFTRFLNNNTWTNWIYSTIGTDFVLSGNYVNGYQMLPSGLKLQWGYVTIEANDATYVSKNVNYPISFSSVFGVFVNSKSNAWMFTNAASITNKNFKLYGIKPNGAVTQTLDFVWFAIGI